MLRDGRLAAATLLALALTASPAASDPTAAIGETIVSGGTVTVTGTATFPAITEPQPVGGSKTAFANATVADAAGIDLTGASIVPTSTGLRFIWQVTNLPAQIPPEGVRYTWSFRIGTRQYQLQAKRTNVVSSTTIEDPVGHAQQAAGQRDFFQLRGACQTEYLGTPIAGCYHLAFLNGSFDIPNRRISIDLPFRTRDSIGRLVAEDFVPGATLVENQTAAMSIAASFQAFVSSATTSSYINGWNPYYVSPRVELAVAGPGVFPEELAYPVRATLNPDGSFTGSIAGVTAQANTVYVRACNGTTCAYADRRVA